jgi:GH25 family lysozyme M1 (1,4-beta-N-acetylmuramidase)
MWTSTFITLALAALGQATIQGFDISAYQPNVNFAAAKSSGAGFVIIKVCLNIPRNSHKLPID